MAALLAVVLDADVLVPILSCDLLLSCFDHDLYQPVVTRRILDEVEHSLAVDFAHLDRDFIVRRVRQVSAALAFHTQPDPAVTDAVAGVNAKDRHVAAIALAARADLVVTNDKRLRREIEALDSPVRAVSSDEFIVGLYQVDPDQVVAVLDAMVTKRTRRPITRTELVAALAGSFPRFAAETRQ